MVVGFAAAVSLAVLAASSIGWASYRYFNANVTRTALKINGARPAERPGDENILLLGDDSREGTNGEYGTQAEVGGIHSDTTIVAHLGADGSATLLSFPRDSLLTLAAGIRGTPSDGRDKLTNILSYAGVDGLIRTLEDLTGLQINHYISVDLAGFKRMTDAVGGVTVCVMPLPNGSTRNLHDDHSGWSGHLGENQLDGEAALAFVRTRYALGDERLRIARQQQFLSKLLAKATSGGVLANPVRVTRLIGAVGGSLKMDSGLSTRDLVTLAQRISGITTGKISFVTIPTRVPAAADGAVDEMGQIPPHGDVLAIDTAAMEQVLAPLRPATPGGPATGGPTVAPGAVTIAEIRNATGRAGLAARTATALAALGFGGTPVITTATAGDATTDGATTDSASRDSASRDRATMMSQVRYPPGQLAQADTLARAIPNARLVEDASAASGLVVVLGPSFTGVPTAASLTGAPPPTAGPAEPAAASPAASAVGSTPSPAPSATPAATGCTA